jgi:CheY-like chemotaxis protein
MKILVVHRQKVEVMEQIKSVLQTNNSIIRFSDSGLDGLLAARIESFDLIICGTDLPVITGFELVRSLRTNSINKYTPVVFLTEVITEKIEHLSNALGVRDMFQLQHLSEKLADVVCEKVKATPDLKWEDLLEMQRMN